MRRPAGAALAAAALFLAGLALFWPGYAMYDTVAQYGQVTDGSFDDWHPPAMARLWSLFAAAGARGAAPMLVLQLALYWAGFGLVAAALRGRAMAAVLAIGAWPLFLGWQGVVLKDAQMTGALLAATGLVGWWRLRGRALPAGAAAGALVLLAYATLVRANAAFASVPLAVLLLAPGRSWRGQAALVIAGVPIVLALLSPVAHGVLGARRTGVERTQALYDLSGVAVRTGDAAAVGLSPAAVAQLAARRCVRPFFWDPLGEPTRCDATVEPLRHVPPGQLYLRLAGAIVRHPLAYAAHRIAHLNSTERWLVPRRWPDAAPPTGSEPNDLGLPSPGAAANGWQAAAGWLAETPFGWPAVWLMLAAAALAIALPRPGGPTRGVMLALLVSALTLEASFAVLSIASDLRYHLWPMIATALAVVLLLAEARPSRRSLVLGGAALALTVAAGTVARLALPLPPRGYAGMLG